MKYQVPAGTELSRLTKKSTVTYIYIGRGVGGSDAKMRVQLNDKLSEVSDIVDYIVEERKRMSPEDVGKMTVSIKADRQVDMGLITDVKQALRQANALRINYSAVSEKR